MAFAGAVTKKLAGDGRARWILVLSTMMRLYVPQDRRSKDRSRLGGGVASQECRATRGLAFTLSYVKGISAETDQGTHSYVPLMHAHYLSLSHGC